MEEHSHGFGELREMVLHLDQRIDRLDQRIVRLDEKIDQRIARLDDKISRQFLWILGVQVAVLISVIGALASA